MPVMRRITPARRRRLIRPTALTLWLFKVDLTAHRGIPVRGPQDRASRIPAAGQRPQGEHPRFSAVSGTARLAGFSRRDRAPSHPKWPQLLAITVSAGVAALKKYHATH